MKGLASNPLFMLRTDDGQLTAFRPFRFEDLNEVAACEAAEGDVHWTRAQFEKELLLPQSRFYVLHNQGRMIGYGGYWNVSGEAQITNFVIRNTNRRQGFGSNLIQYLLRQAKQEGCTRVTLEVRMNNTAAKILYEKAGFITRGCRPGVYENPKDDALLMEREL